MNDSFGDFRDLFDSFIGNKRETPAPAPKPTVTIDEIIRRKTCVVRYGGKLYTITAREMKETK